MIQQDVIAIILKSSTALLMIIILSYMIIKDRKAKDKRNELNEWDLNTFDRIFVNKWFFILLCISWIINEPDWLAIIASLLFVLSCGFLVIRMFVNIKKYSKIEIFIQSLFYLLLVTDKVYSTFF